MFGLIYSLAVGLGLAGHTIKENIENDYRRVNNVSPDGITYTDAKGRSRIVENNEIAIYGTIKGGDFCILDAKGRIYKNFTQEKKDKIRDKYYKKAIENNLSTYCLGDDEHRFEDRAGKRFKDMKTGRIYLIRCVNFKYYYVDFETGEIVRKTDYQQKKDDAKINKRDATFFDINIDEWNERCKKNWFYAYSLTGSDMYQ